MTLYQPGKVMAAPLLVCRFGTQNQWMKEGRGSSSFHFDRDISASYHDALTSHLLGVIHGINTSLLLWGDRQWFSSLANGDVYQLADRCVQHLRAPRTMQQAPVKLFKMVFSSHIYDCQSGALHDVAQRELVSAETQSLAQILPAADRHCILVVRFLVLINDHECSFMFVIPPPYEDCNYDVHRVLRQSCDASASPLLFSQNSLDATVFHSSSPEPPGDEVMTSLEKLRRRLCAPVPNSQALLHLLRSAQSSATEASSSRNSHSATNFGKQRADELLNELRAMENELVSVRAAYVAAVEKSQSLERALNRVDPTSENPSTKALLIDPASVQRELLRVCEELLRRLNVDLIDLDRRVMTIEKQTGAQPDAKLRALLYWRQQACETLVQRLSDAPMAIVSGGKVLPLRAQLGGSGNKMETALVGGADQGAPPAHTHGTKHSVDPLVILYESRLIELENEVAKMIDVDIKACIDEYYVKELALSERELLEWMTRARAAEEQHAVIQQALHAKQ